MQCYRLYQFVYTTCSTSCVKIVHIGVPIRGIQIEKYTCTLKRSTLALLQVSIFQSHKHLNFLINICVWSLMYNAAWRIFYALSNKPSRVLIFIKFVNKEIMESATNELSWKIEYMAISICMYILNTSHWSYIYDTRNVVNIETICLLPTVFKNLFWISLYVR